MSDLVTLALVGGTGLNELGGAIGEIELETPYGIPSGPIFVVVDSPVRILFLPRHGQPHRFPLRQAHAVHLVLFVGLNEHMVQVF